MSLLHQINETSGCAHHDLNTLIECLDLWFVGSTTVDRQYPDLAMFTCLLYVFSHLDRQLPSGNDDKCLRQGLGLVNITGGRYSLQNGHCESQSLPGSSFGLADQIGTTQRER